MVRTILAWSVPVFMLWFAAWYALLIQRKAVAPNPATWCMFAIATVLGIVTYQFAPQHDWGSNVGALADALVVGLLFGFLLRSRPAWELTRTTALCYACTALIALFWLFSVRNNARLANGLLQIVLVIAYVPMFRTLWRTARNTEPFGPWLVLWFGGLCATALAWTGKDILPRIYAGRWMVLTGIVLLLMVRVERKKQRFIK